MNKYNIKIIIGGPLGILAWSASAGSMLIIFFWGLEKSALAVIAVKTVSWGMWGVGVIRESTYLSSLEARFNRWKEARRLCSCFSWGLGLYLCSFGERGSLKGGELPGRLQFYYVYYVPGEGRSPLPLFTDNFPGTEKPMTRRGVPSCAGGPVFITNPGERYLPGELRNS